MAQRDSLKAVNITGTGNTTIISGPGWLEAITINTKGASANTLTVYDNTTNSGTKIGTIDTTLGQQTLWYTCNLKTGLTVASATGTGADVTVTYTN